MYNRFVWSTQYRRKVLIGSIAEGLKGLQELISKQKDITLINQEKMPDYIRLFVTAPPLPAPVSIARISKGIVAKKLFETY